MGNLLGFSIMQKSTDEPEMQMESLSKKSIAVIGMAIRFPQADNPQTFWRNLANGSDAIRDFPLSRRKDTDPYLQGKGLLHQDFSYVKGAFLEEVDRFDYRFFGLSHREASLMDPSQRLFLETAWQAIEDSGYGGNCLIGTNTGVYLGFSNDFDTETTYKRYIADLEPESMPLAVTGNIKAIIASRLSYLLDLRGPSMLVDTTCSSSLVAIHTACQAIRNGECDMALAGGIELHLLPLKVMDREKMGIESSDYKTKSFDDSSDGAGNGEGVAVIVLKPLDRAVRDRDPIYAVIKGSAVNQDGSSIGLTAPNAAAQEQVILRAWKEAGIDPAQLSYVEAHGSGTPLGDPIEVAGLTNAFAHFTDRKQFCGVGSVKTNLGHLGNSAGIAGFVKSVLALQHKKLPASLHFQRPNRKINFKGSPLYVVDELTDWPAQDDSPRRSGINSFGLSGTNCHIVLEEAPLARSTSGRSIASGGVLPLSAKSSWSLQRLVESYDELLSEPREIDPADLCYTAAIGRGHYSHRLAILFDGLADLKKTVRRLAEQGVEAAEPPHAVYGVQKSTTGGSHINKESLAEEEGKQISRKADALLTEPGKFDLSELAGLYVAGANVRWQRLYPQGNRVRIPVYPFEPIRCWLDVPAYHDSYYHAIEWKRFNDKQVDETVANGAGTVLLLKDKHGRADRLREMLERSGTHVIEAAIGTEYKRLSETSYVLGHNQASYDRLLGELSQVTVTQVVHLVALSGGQVLETVDELEEAQRRGVNSLFYLTKAILHNKWKHRIHLLLLGQNVHEVTRNEAVLYPEAAALMGLGKVVSHEYPHIVCRCLDIDGDTSDEQIVATFGRDQLPYTLASRGGQLYAETLKPFDPQASGQQQIVLKSGGVYLITGGSGGMALEIAKYLSAQGNLNMAFLSRTPFPNRHSWKRLLAEGTTRKMRESILCLQEIEENGANVRFYAVDVANESKMAGVIADLKKEFGRINGIVHCAGVAGNGFLVRKEEAVFEEVLAPKIRGTWVLDRLTKDDPPDFFVLFSSISTLISAVGQGDYTAANAYLDAFSRARTKQGRRTLSLNWAMWKETGMALDYNVRNDSCFRELHTKEALLAFDGIFHTEASNVIIGELKHEEVQELLTGDTFGYLSPELRDRIVKRAPANTGIPATGERPVRPVQANTITNVTLKGKEEGSFSDIEQKLASIWSKLMGMDSISIHDNFYDIGGNSILATHLLRELDEAFPNHFDITDIFSYPTISLMVEYLDSRLNVASDTEPPNSSLDELLDQLSEGKLSIEEVNELMKSVGEDQWKT
ncbi:SDR family NAD(P)-dependent oxidoreductase [Paenibacillus sp. chi10]|uniref:SDR family NAD(P)-dependent oxidoreductase n=1 Tax=Paenibacillus suaedae TaxID=3077233 RepID=A0AAJ2JYA4_9BACL|nr:MULTISPECIES: type I polyketide synthase [unclassified Paenibacillus]MDT8977090.1 SDR family NAD(P)-dependent oxidoreductase [Paenibacillus sp. chi10]GAV15983.1 beta-ketoacyl synthase family protein,phosphopantetheine-containing protein [Paenibacillus sp. NAIST15-1]